MAIGNGTVLALEMPHTIGAGIEYSTPVVAWSRTDLSMSLGFVEAPVLLLPASASASRSGSASGAVAVVGGYAGGVVALRISDGASIWETELDGPIASAPALFPGEHGGIAVALQSAEVVLLSPASGTECGRVRIPPPASNTAGGVMAVATGGIMEALVGNVDGGVYAASGLQCGT